MESKIIRAEEVAKELDVSVPYAYKIIRKLNDELKEKGYITVSGRVNRQYFNERNLFDCHECGQRFFYGGRNARNG